MKTIWKKQRKNQEDRILSVVRIAPSLPGEHMTNINIETVIMTVMPKFILVYIITAILIETECKTKYPDVNPRLEKRLNQEERRSVCCSKNMRCCKRHKAAPSNVEIRAVIARCIDPPQVCSKNRNMKKILNLGNAPHLQKFQGFDEDEPLVQSEVTKCVKKLILTLKMKNQGQTNTQPQFIVIDHVYDPLTDKTVRLLNPYVIKMKQEQINQAYPLIFMDFVNSQAKEQVYNKHDGNYTGCCTKGKNPTCGLISYRGIPIPYSEGFCCSCDAEKNTIRQPQADSSSVIGYSDPAYLYDAVQCPRTSITSKEKGMQKEKEKKKHKLHKSHKQKGNHKRNMDDYNVYYVDPRTQHIKPDSLRESHRFVERSSKGFGDTSGETNYKIQSMNDEYEDQLINRANPISLEDKSRLRSSAIQSEDKHDNRKENVKTNKFVGKKLKNPVRNKQITLKDEPKTDSTEKPSMHTLLQTGNVPLNSHAAKLDKKVIVETVKSYVESEARKSKKNMEYSNENEELSPVSYGKRQIQSSGVQLRGGQNCADRYTPSHVNPESYHESTHCLRFSRIWYGVYRLEQPIVDEEIFFEVFEKYETPGGAVKWKDLTKGRKIKLGTFVPTYRDELPTISMMFSSVFDDEDFCLNWKKMRLLIPEGPDLSELPSFPEAKRGPAEYLLVPSEKIVLSGDRCNVAGVGFEGFFKQPNRCSVHRGSCLHHQPYHMWLHDKTLERSGKQGCFFLKYHGVLPKNPIRKNESSNEKFLNLNYYGKSISIVDMEINADFNAVLRMISNAIITEVYIDSTCGSSTVITVKVSNSGLLSSKFMVRVCDCPLELQDKFNDLQSELVIIPPQHQHIFRLNFHSSISVDIFHCSVEALNAKGELVALRRIKIQKFDRCICTWHCLCACIGSSAGLKCVPMKMDHYHAAGFKGGLPVVTRADHSAIPGDVYRLLAFIMLFIIFTLFLLGLTKAIIGICCLPMGMWGLDTLLDLPKPMKKYYEKSLTGRAVEYDQIGWPIHPDTKRRVRNMPSAVIFCTNLLFFFTYPTVVFILVFKQLCCPFYQYETVKKSISEKTSKDELKETKSEPRTPPQQDQKSDIGTDTASTVSMKKRKKMEKKMEKRKSKEKPSEETAATSEVTLKRPSGFSTPKGIKLKRKSRKGESPRMNKSPKRRKSRPPRRSDSPKRKKWISPHAKKSKSPKRSKSRKRSKSAERSESPKRKTSESPRESKSRGDFIPVHEEYSTDRSKGDGKPKPTIKVSIREHGKHESRDSIPKKKTSIEISDNPYYYSSTDNVTTYSSSSPYTGRTTNRSPDASSRTSSA